MLIHIYYNSIEKSLISWYNFCILKELNQKKEYLLWKGDPILQFFGFPFRNIFAKWDPFRKTGLKHAIINKSTFSKYRLSIVYVLLLGMKTCSGAKIFLLWQ